MHEALIPLSPARAPPPESRLVLCRLQTALLSWWYSMLLWLQWVEHSLWLREEVARFARSSARADQRYHPRHVGTVAIVK